MNLFLDACVIIYLIEAREPFFSTVQTTLQAINDENASTSIVVSRLSLLECLVNPLKRQEAFIIEQYRSFFSRQDLKIVELVPELVEKALWLRVRYNLRIPDALQVSSALLLPGEHLFLTGDRSLTRVVELNSRII